MASVFKRGRWVDENGRKCNKDAPGAKWAESRFYTVQVFVDGKSKSMKGYTDKAASEQMGAKMERAKAQGEQGLIDPYKEHKVRPLAEHIREYVSELRTLGRDDKYIYNVDKRLAKLIKLCGWKVLGDITADTLCRWRENPIEQKEADSDGGKIGHRTLNQYFGMARAFCLWCIKRKRMAANPLIEVEKLDETADVRRARRALTMEQVILLLAVVPEHYQLAYRMILSTGLRRDELRQLRWGDVRLDSPSPFIQLRASTTKAKRADVLPIRVDLAQLLRLAKGDAQDGDNVFLSLPTMDEHREYLEAAEIPYVDEDGRRADIHSLRHTYGTLLSKAGVAPRVAMALMRHTDIKLTMNCYTDPRIFDLAGAVEKLPALGGDRPQAQAATGTDGKPLPSGRSESVSSPSAGLGHCLAVIGEPDRKAGRSLTLDSGGNRQQKTPSGGDGVDARQVGHDSTGNVNNPPQNQHIHTAGAVKASVALFPPVFADADIAMVVAAWPDLPADVRRLILNCIKLGKGRQGGDK